MRGSGEEGREGRRVQEGGRVPHFCENVVVRVEEIKMRGRGKGWVKEGDREGGRNPGKKEGELLHLSEDGMQHARRDRDKFEDGLGLGVGYKEGGRGARRS